MHELRIDTPNNLEYSYFPITSHYQKISVTAEHDARICLRNNLSDDSDYYEIILGGWGNTMSAIKKNGRDPDIAEAADGILSDDISHFWIHWSCDGWIKVGSLEGNDKAFLTYQDQNPFVINFIGVGTAWGATGKWTLSSTGSSLPAVMPQLIDTSIYWLNFDSGYGLPRNAVPIDTENDLYIGRARHRKSVTPGNIRGSSCIIGWDGRTHEKKKFQVLCGLHAVEWVKSRSGSVPLNALPAGETETGFPLFIGRIKHNGVYYIGKIQPDHQACYVPFNGRENNFQVYETLIIKNYPFNEFVGR